MRFKTFPVLAAPIWAGTFPDTVVMAATESSGEFKAKRSARESSIPGSQSITILHIKKLSTSDPFSVSRSPPRLQRISWKHNRKKVPKLKDTYSKT